jgi:hypothetical protein
MQIVEERVRPQREASGQGGGNDKKKRAGCWWQFARTAKELYTRIADQNRVLVCAQTSKYRSFTFLPSGVVYDQKLIVFAFDNWCDLAVMQSQTHVHWAWFFGSTLEDRPVYTPTDCFATFPFPLNWNDNPQLDAVGRGLGQFRADLMKLNTEGLTSTYNRFHDPHEKSPEILKLRELHEAMDRAVMEAYGWHDLAQTARCEFLLDYEEEDEETGKKKSKKKKPWRLRWADDFRDEVLARLLELNEQRHKEELLAGKQLGKAEKPPKPAKASQPRKPRKAATRDLFTSSLEPGHRSLLMLLRAWNGRAVTRRLLNAGLILMLDDKLRAALVETGSRPKGRRKSTPDLNQLFTELEIDGFIETVPTTHQQAWRVTAIAPTTDDASPDEVHRLAETMQYLNRAQSAGQITVNEETVDAEVDLIPA